ncbi:MAG: DUF58 domain-containing protein [Bacteroidia bacterium]|nr:DUF58 domain-containing protein [Bacteroidia bacterium]MCF8426230.1 DUF58 domain-containing protein [Bacteroidia bacterium]MCF8448020.1 DUF58 domain-containing protein [Bacteroidia bacterium]
MAYQITESDLLQISNLELLARQVVEGFLTGLHKSPYHGFSVEFAEHRQYNSGESTRNIDWKLFARTDKLFVKRFEEETNLRCQIVIDTSSSMYFPNEGLNKIRFSVIAAASLIQLMKKQRDASGISLFNEELWFHSPSKLGLTHQKLLFSKLQSCLSEPIQGKRSEISKTLHTLAEGLHKRSFVIIFSDMFQSGSEDIFSALQHLRYNNHEVILFDVHDKKSEHDFDFGHRPYIFKDSETGEELKLHPNAVKEKYLQNYNAHKENLKLKCLQYKIDYNEALVENDFNQVLMPFIKKKKNDK